MICNILTVVPEHIIENISLLIMSTNPGAAVIQLILTSISDHQNQTLQDNLNKLPLAIISNSQADSLFALLINHAFKINNSDATRIIVTTFDVVRARVNLLPAITNIFLNPSLDRDTILFVTSCFPEKIPIDFFVDLINMGNDMDALKAAAMIITIFPSVSHEDWTTLVSLTDNVEEEEYENKLLRAFFQTKASETGSYAKSPEWVRSDIPKLDLTEVPDYIPSVKDAVNLLLEDMRNRHVLPSNYDDTKSTLISQYAISSTIEKIQILSIVKSYPVFDDRPLFHQFGPVNTLYSDSTSHLDKTHVCSKFGGCRMFSCNCFKSPKFDDIDIMTCDDHIFIDDWFTGSCDICLKKIRHPRHAIRLPLYHGGWRGCYCSDDRCLSSDVKDVQTTLMVARIKEQLRVIGVHDA